MSIKRVQNFKSGKGQNFLFKEILFKEKWAYILNSLSPVIFFLGGGSGINLILYSIILLLRPVWRT